MALNRNIFSVPNNERSIDSFKSRLVSGGARPNLFEVEMDFPSGVGIFDEEIDNTTHRMMIKEHSYQHQTSKKLSYHSEVDNSK